MSDPSSDRPRRRGLAALLWLIVLAVLVGGAFVGFRALRPTAVVEPVVSAPAIDAKPGSVTVTEEYPQDVRPELGGRIIAQDFNLSPGQRFHKGEILARLDPGDLQLALEKTRIDYEATKAKYQADHSLDFALEAAKVALANAKRQHDIGAISDQDFDAAQRSMKATQQQLQLAAIDRKQTLATFENTIATEERQIDKMTLRAEFDGVVKEVLAHPGELVSPGTSIAHLITLTKVVVGKISDEYFAEIKVGQPAFVTFIPYGSFLFNGKVTQILPTTDPETQRHIVHLSVDIPDEKLVPGINGELAITVGEHTAQTVVPRRAVFSTDGDDVFVVKDGVVHQRRVKEGYVWARGVEILEGLQPGDLVIVEGLENFHDGDHVQVEQVPADVLAKTG